MAVDKLRGSYHLLEEKDRKIFRGPGACSHSCVVSCCSSWLVIRLSQGALPCLGHRVPGCLGLKGPVEAPQPKPC